MAELLYDIYQIKHILEKVVFITITQSTTLFQIFFEFMHRHKFMIKGHKNYAKRQEEFVNV